VILAKNLDKGGLDDNDNHCRLHRLKTNETEAAAPAFFEDIPI
jgi:hypothetical protein